MDPKRKSPGIQGYVKLSCIVLQPGDEAIVHDPEEAWEEVQTGDSLQSMVLLPPTINYTNYQLSIKVLKAIDLIKMDLDGKCDPFVRVAFGATDMKSSVKDNKLNPEWNEEILVPFVMPIMTKTITVQVLDEDFGSADDLIAEIKLNINDIINGIWHEPRWVPLYRKDFDGMDGQIAKINETGIGNDRSKVNRGSILIAADIHETPNPVCECRPCPGLRGPTDVNYVLRVDVYELNDVPLDGKVRISARPGNKESTKSKTKSLKHGHVEFREQLKEQVYQFPEDKTQIPDIEISVYQEGGILSSSQRFGYVRLPAKILTETRPTWHEIVPDAIGGPQQLHDNLPGFILLSAKFEVQSKMKGQRDPLQNYTLIPYQVRAHVYQARNLKPHDKSGNNDPFVICQIGPVKGKTRIIEDTNDPTWYETVILDNVQLPEVLEHAPYITFKVFDEDKWPDTKDFIGKTQLRPEKLSPTLNKPSWKRLEGEDEDCGDILVSAQLIPMKDVKKFPEVSIVPESKKCISELGMLSLHDIQLMHGFELAKPSIQIAYGSSQPISTKTYSAIHGGAPIYETIVQEIDVPSDPVFASSINLVLYNKGFTGKSIAGSAHVDLSHFYPWIYQEEKDIQLLDNQDEESYNDDDLDIDLSTQVALLESQLLRREDNYDEELIALEDDNLLTDFKNAQESIANLANRTAPMPPDAEFDHPLGDEEPEAPKRERITKPLETRFKSPFLEIPFRRERRFTKTLADQAVLKSVYQFSEADNYVASPPISQQFKQQEVVVRCYILRGRQLNPNDPDGLCDPWLEVSCGGKSIRDRDNVREDTLDPLFFSMYEFRTTLPGDDTSLDIKVWDRDDRDDDIVGTTSIELADRWYSREWQNMDQKPIEMRTLHVPTSKMERGKLELWVDIMTPEEARKNPPEDIRPPQPERWQVRAIVWTVSKVIFDGKVDLFVTAKLGDQKHQLTDTHWSSPDGNGEFNWRMIWDVIIPNRKDNRLLLQVWDKNMVQTNEALAECTVNLTNVFKNAYKNGDVVNIEKQLIDMNLPYKTAVQGAIEIEIEIVPYQYAQDHPERPGNETLPKPTRPPPPWDVAAKAGDAFNWMKENIAGPMKKKLIIAACVVGGVLILALIIWIAL
jgi:hypothetical protein